MGVAKRKRFVRKVNYSDSEDEEAACSENEEEEQEAEECNGHLDDVEVAVLKDATELRKKGDIIACAGEGGDVPWIAVLVNDHTSPDTVSVRWLRPQKKEQHTGSWVEMKGKNSQVTVHEGAVLGIIVWDDDGPTENYMGVGNWGVVVDWLKDYHSNPDN